MTFKKNTTNLCIYYIPYTVYRIPIYAADQKKKRMLDWDNRDNHEDQHDPEATRVNLLDLKKKNLPDATKKLTNTLFLVHLPETLLGFYLTTTRC